MIRCFGKVMGTKDRNYILSKSHGYGREFSFHQQSLDEEDYPTISALLRQKINTERGLHLDIITARGYVHEHTDNLEGLSKTAYLLPLVLPKHVDTYLFQEQKQKVALKVGHLYTFNQWVLHSVDFSRYSDAKTVYLVANLIL